MSDQLFSLAGIATLGWVLLILLPRWWATRRMAELEVFPIYLALLYLVGVVPLVVAAGPGIIRDFGNADGVANLLAQRDVALIAWIHILVFDQVVGVLIYRDNMSHRYLPIFGQSAILVLTFLFGPVGYLAYSAARELARRRRSQAARRMWRKEEAIDVAMTQPTLRTTCHARLGACACLLAAWSRERGVFAVGLLGLVLGAARAGHGGLSWSNDSPGRRPVESSQFRRRVGIFLLTLAVFVGLAPFTERGRRVWSGTVVVLSLVSYAMENIQISRGIDPRFSHVGSVADQLGGAFFLLIATGVLVTFVILFAKILLNVRQPEQPAADAGDPLRLRGDGVRVCDGLSDVGRRRLSIRGRGQHPAAARTGISLSRKRSR